LIPGHPTPREDNFVDGLAFNVKRWIVAGEPYTIQNDPMSSLTYTSPSLRRTLLAKEASEVHSLTCLSRQSSTSAGKDLTEVQPPMVTENNSVDPITEVVPDSPPLSDTSTIAATSDDDIQLSDFAVLEVIGKGAFGKVLRVIHKTTGMIYALKVVAKAMQTERQLEDVMAEVEALRRVSGLPGFLQIMASFHDAQNYYILTVRLGVFQWTPVN
jgi:hypothetical protein